MQWRKKKKSSTIGTREFGYPYAKKRRKGIKDKPQYQPYTFHKS
jgi:hypothetical protein